MARFRAEDNTSAKSVGSASTQDKDLETVEEISTFKAGGNVENTPEPEPQTEPETVRGLPKDYVPGTYIGEYRPAY